MALTELDRMSALIVIDLQKGITSRPIDGAEQAVRNSARLADAFRKHHLPVVLVNAVGTAPGRTEQHRPNMKLDADFAELDAALNKQDSDILVSKRTWGAFTGTDLDDKLRSRGVTQVVFTGIATSIGVESSARQAHELGYNVSLITDAMTDLSPEGHKRSIDIIFPRLGESGTTSELLDLLDKHGT